MTRGKMMILMIKMIQCNDKCQELLYAKHFVFSVSFNLCNTYDSIAVKEIHFEVKRIWASISPLLLLT